MLFWMDINLHNRKRLSGSPINHQSTDWWNSYLKELMKVRKTKKIIFKGIYTNYDRQIVG